MFVITGTKMVYGRIQVSFWTRKGFGAKHFAVHYPTKQDAQQVLKSSPYFYKMSGAPKEYRMSITELTVPEQA